MDKNIILEEIKRLSAELKKETEELEKQGYIIEVKHSSIGDDKLNLKK